LYDQQRRHCGGANIQRLKGDRVHYFTRWAMAGRTGSWALLLWFLAGVCAADTGVRVGLATVETTDILRELRLTGTVTAQHDASLSVAAAGLVADIVVDTGAQVAAGDVLLRMDAELAQLRHAAAQAQVAQAEVRARDAQRRLQEAQSLLPQRSIAETTVRELVADRDAARATLQQVTAEASLAQALLARHTLRAPFAGVISLRRAERGEWLTPGQAVFDLVGLEDLRLDFAVPEDYLASLQEGAPMTFTTAARPAQEFTGTVASLVPVTDTAARTFLLRIAPADSARDALLPGMSVSARLALATGRKGISVPRDALVRYPDGRVVVWTAKPEGGALVARENTVTTGLAFAGQIEITQGLTVNEQVVVRGNEALQPGLVLAPTGDTP
tara:strand:+ start:9899 stop:11059 length:1161 start_codon:yes stop_codon:yes gene_type:complete